MLSAKELSKSLLHLKFMLLGISIIIRLLLNIFINLILNSERGQFSIFNVQQSIYFNNVLILSYQMDTFWLISHLFHIEHQDMQVCIRKYSISKSATKFHICFTNDMFLCRNYNPVPFSRIRPTELYHKPGYKNMSNTTDVSCGAESAYPTGAPWITSSFGGVRVA